MQILTYSRDAKSHPCRAPAASGAGWLVKLTHTILMHALAAPWAPQRALQRGGGVPAQDSRRAAALHLPPLCTWTSGHAVNQLSSYTLAPAPRAVARPDAPAP